jgi:hypothetical protein
MEGKFEINRGGNNAIGQSGIGFIVVPDDNTRQQYIDDCYRTSTVTINGGFGYGYISAVKILPDVLQKIRFPLKSKERGTPVLWLRENFSNRPIVIGIISEEGYTNLLKENQNRFVQEIDGKTVEIFQDANSATLNINVVGKSDTPANINIKVASGSEDSVVNIDSDGKVNVSANDFTATARNTFNIFLKDGKNDELISLIGDSEKMEFKDKFGNVITSNEENVNITVAGKFNVNSGKEPMVLGQTLVDLLSEILDAIKQITVVTPVGTSSVPVNIASFTSAQQKLKNILSTISNLD